VRIVHAFADMMPACSSTTMHERAACTERNDCVTAPASMSGPCTSQARSERVVQRLFQGPDSRRAWLSEQPVVLEISDEVGVQGESWMSAQFVV
jgi:hypothetical protein